MSDLMEQAGPEVSVADQAVAELGGDAGEEQSPFFEFGDGDKKLAFKTPDELKEHLSKSINFESDYTKKSQQREAEYRKKMEEIQRKDEEFRKQQEEWEKSTKSKYDKYEEVLKTRPAVAKELARLAETPVTPNEIYDRSRSYADEKTSELEQKLQALIEEREAEKLERQRDSVYAELEKDYPDIREVSTKALSELDGNDMRQLVEMVYKASKYNPQEIREAVEQDIARKSGAKMVPGGGGPPPASKGSTDPREAHAQAMREYAGITE